MTDQGYCRHALRTLKLRALATRLTFAACDLGENFFKELLKAAIVLLGIFINPGFSDFIQQSVDLLVFQDDPIVLTRKSEYLGCGGT